MLKEDIINEIKKKQLPVIICGAGIVGKVLLSVCRKEGIEVECFCDSSKKVAQSKFCDMEVIYTPNLKTKYKEVIILISAATIKDVVDLLHDLGFSNWYAGGLLLKDLDISQNQSEAAIDYTKYVIETCIWCHESYLNPDKLFLRSIDLIITERCSLRCKHCSNLMQYYENPKNCNSDMLLKSIDVFCSIIDEVLDFRVIGGETFMNKEWPIVVKRLIDEPKAKRVVIYINGTLVPNEESFPYLKNDKVFVLISDYGPLLSRKVVELKQLFEKNKIAYSALKFEEWSDCSAIKPHNRSIDENKEIYKRCCGKNMATLSDGKLFRCPYSANAARLQAVPDYKNDYIDLFQEPLDPANISDTKNKVKKYLLHKDYLETCDYCNGRPLSGPEIQPAVQEVGVAIQADKPLAYHKYAIENKKTKKIDNIKIKIKN